MTLVEMVIAVVIMGIMAVGVTTFITQSASSYTRTATSNQLSSAGRFLIDRVAMELHNALPESIRISTPLSAADEAMGEGYAGDQCLEYIPVLAATTYLDPAFRPQPFKLSFSVVDFVPNQEGQVGLYAVIYPTSSNDLYGADLNGVGSPLRATEAIARVDVSAGPMNSDVLTYSRLADNAPYRHRFKRESAVDRVFLVSTPVSFCITGNKLFRYSNYGFTPQQMLPLEPGGDCTAGVTADCLPATTPSRALFSNELDHSMLTGGAAGQAFDQLAASRRRNAVIQLEFNFSQRGQEVRLNHEVLLQTAP